MILFSPRDIEHLQIPPGGSSSDLNAFDPDAFAKSSLSKTHAYEAVLIPGDILFIPPLWAHAAAPTEGISVAVNVFFNEIGGEQYGRSSDAYGNRDPAEYAEARRNVAKMVKSLETAPAVVRQFYITRLGRELLDHAEE